MASIQADPSFEGNLNRCMDFDFTIACLFYLTWRWNLISPKDYHNYLIMTRVFHGPIGIFNFVHVQSFSVPSSRSENYNCLRNASKYFIFIFLWWLSAIIFFRLNVSDEQLKNRMLMAVPKKGRLYDQCIALLDRAGVKVIWTRLNI